VEVKGIRWIGVATDNVSQTRSFAVEVLGLRVVGQESEDFVELDMGDGAKLELFGPAAAADGPWLFASNPVVGGFLVDDIEAARDELAGTPDVELLGELRVLPGGYAWQHFRAPDGHVYELTADPSASS
jgi:catechol 2,3-dioxygenase-like lactoylglutathione lyase family enzyme